MSRPIRAWNPCAVKSSEATTGNVWLKSGVPFGGPRITKATSYCSTVAGFAPVVGVFTRIVPVGVKPSAVSTDGSIAVPVAPVSKSPLIGIGLGTCCFAAIRAVRLGTLTPTYASTIGPLGDTCSVKWDNGLQLARFTGVTCREMKWACSIASMRFTRKGSRPNLA